MGHGNIAAYQGTGRPQIIGDGIDRWMEIYNDTGTALADGAIYNIVVGTDTAGVPYYKAIAPAENDAVANIIGVVDNSPEGLTTIADKAYGFVKVRGKVLALVDGDTEDVAIGDGLEVLSAGVSFLKDTDATNDGKHAVQTCAVALEVNAGASALASVFLLGKLSAIAAAD